MRVVVSVRGKLYLCHETMMSSLRGSRHPSSTISDQWPLARNIFPNLVLQIYQRRGLMRGLVPFTCYSPASSSIMLFYEYYIGFTWTQRCVCVLLWRAVRSTHKITDISIFSPSTSAREKCMHR